MTRSLPIALILVGLLGLTYGGLGSSGQGADINAGPVAIADVDERVNVPMWIGLGSILIGAYLLVRRRNV